MLTILVVRCYLQLYSLECQLMRRLTSQVFKIIAPYFVLSCFLRQLTTQLQLPPLSLFLTILAFADGVFCYSGRVSYG